MIRDSFNAAVTETMAKRAALATAELGEPEGVYLEIESDPQWELALKSLDLVNGEIQLMNAFKQPASGAQVAVIFIPDGMLGKFLKKIQDYLTKNAPRSRNPKNQELIERISSLKRATLRSFWTDDPALYPDDGESIWWEIWLRGSDGSHLEAFKAYAEKKEIKVGRSTLQFLDRTVVLAYGTSRQLSDTVDAMSVLAELRAGKDTPEFFMSLSLLDQLEWVQNLEGRTIAASTESPYICILDTGVSHAHPLLATSLLGSDVHTINASWGTADKEGHGTEMAGVALFGDLREALGSPEKVTLTHRLESVKILPASGDENDRDLYGAFTAQAVGRVEIQDPTRQRVFAMAVTSHYQKFLGEPSSWSAEIDSLASGFTPGDPDGPKRLFIISAGNRRFTEGRADYFDECLTDRIHSPAQAWNALTVGAYTELCSIEDPQFQSWKPLAHAGDLSPSSTTSVDWRWRWPIKPDVVMEGGNGAVNPLDETEITATDCLSVLTTAKGTMKQLKTVGGTSPAAASAAHLAAKIEARYTDLWPETVRGMIVHSGRWTPAMTSRINPKRSKKNAEILARCFGSGVPDELRALNSYRNALTLVIEDQLQPFDIVRGKAKSNEMHFHQLPWSGRILQSIGEVPIRLRVTLSYFVEPSPASRGWKYRHRYASHGLRFDMQTPTESQSAFRRRINAAIQAAEEEVTPSQSDSANWVLGVNARGRGSVHWDIWEGPASALTQRTLVGVYPVIGWWRERPQINRWDRTARYSLLISIETPDEEVDLYTPIAQAVHLSQEVEVSQPIELEGL